MEMTEEVSRPGSLTLVIIRMLDLTLASLMLLLLSPVLVVTALLVRIKLGSPVFFRQLRSGRHNVPFRIIKFRSMLNSEDTNGKLLADHERLTPFGRFLRKASLDELPELFNVLIGDMSLVGPRPLFVEYWDYYTAAERHRFDVRPGITGLAQISGRNYIGWDRKLALDINYVERISVALYFSILFRTAFSLFSWHQVSADPYAAEQPLDIERMARRSGDRNEQQ